MAVDVQNYTLQPVINGVVDCSKIATDYCSDAIAQNYKLKLLSYAAALTLAALLWYIAWLQGRVDFKRKPNKPQRPEESQREVIHKNADE